MKCSGAGWNKVMICVRRALQMVVYANKRTKCALSQICLKQNREDVILLRPFSYRKGSILFFTALFWNLPCFLRLSIL